MRRGIIGLEDDRKIWVEAHKNFQADIDDMEVIRLDPDRDLRFPPFLMTLTVVTVS